MLGDSEYQSALLSTPTGATAGPGDGTKTLTPVQKEHWNKFIDYLDKSGYKGNAELDNRDKKLGQDLLDKFNKQYPESQITYQDVPVVQQELQNYRQQLINKWKSGQASADGIKDASEIMPGISQVDGWLGSKTSSYKFPVATLTQTDGTKKDFGVNVDQYDKLVSSYKKNK